MSEPDAVAVFHPDYTVSVGTRSSCVRTPVGRIIREQNEPADIPSEVEPLRCRPS